MKAPYKILIVDDHPMFSFGTKGILEQMEHVIVVGVAPTGEACMEQVVKHKPNLVLLDYMLPDQSGYDLARKIHALQADIQVVIFTGIDFMPMYDELLNLNISGILSKGSSDGQLRNVVRCLMEGQMAIPITLFKQLRLDKSRRELPSLTEQEIVIMSLLAKGLTHEQIGENLFTSKRSIDNYLRKIYEKLGAQNKSQAIQKFIQSGGLHEHGEQRELSK